MIRALLLSASSSVALLASPAVAQASDPDASAALGMAVQAKTLAIGRNPAMVISLGDSRRAADFLDALHRAYGNRSQLNVANALLDQRLVIDDTLGVSGDRTDQMLARVDAAIASGAGILYFQGGVNNIAAVASGNPGFTYTHAVTGEIVTINTVATVTARDIIQACERARLAGMKVVIEQEVGAQGIGTTEKQTALMDLRAYLSDYARRTPNVYLHDATAIVMQSGTLAFKANYAYDLTHVNARGGYHWGKSLATLLGQLVPPMASPLVRNAIEVPANGRRQLLTNPIFATATGGTLGANASGTVPAGWTGLTSNAATTATFGTTADAAGVGNNVTIAANFGGAGQTVRFEQSLSGTSAGAYASVIQAGDLVEAVAKIEVTDSPSSLAAAYLLLSVNTGTGGASYDSSDLFGPGDSANAGINEPTVLTLRTRPFRMPAAVGSYPFAVISARFVSSGSGTANLKVHQIALRRVQ